MSKKILLVIFFGTALFASFGQSVSHYVTLEPMSATAQYAVSQITGTPFREIGLNSDVTGNQFLFDYWKSGDVILYNGQKFNNVMLKFDALHNKFYFNRNDSMFELMDDVAEVQMNNTDDDKVMDFKKIITKNGNDSFTTFVEVLSIGKVTLYKEYIKKFEGENFTNGIFTSERQIVSRQKLWALINNRTNPIKLNSLTMQELTADRKNEMENFIKAKRINVKREKGFAEAITYYNSISESPQK